MKLLVASAAALVLAGSVGADQYYAWDTVLITTSTPPGTGYALWRSPEPVITNADEYVCTSALRAVGYLLQFPTVVDVGVVGYATNSGPITAFPHVLFDNVVTQAITDPLSAWYTMRLLASIHTGGYVQMEVIQYQSYGGSPPNTSTPLPSRLELRGELTNGLGTAVTAVPEPCAWLGVWPGLVVWKRRRMLANAS